MSPKEAAKVLASPRLHVKHALWSQDRNKRKAARKVIRAAGGVVGPND